MPVDSALYAFFPSTESTHVSRARACINNLRVHRSVSALHSLPSGIHFLGLTVEVNWKP